LAALTGGIVKPKRKRAFLEYLDSSHIFITTGAVGQRAKVQVRRPVTFAPKDDIETIPVLWTEVRLRLALK
jgi:hypothetical protein